MKLHKVLLSFSILMLSSGALADNDTKGIWSMIFGDEEAALSDNQDEAVRHWDDCWDCHSQRLKVKKLCAKFAKICKADIEKLRVKKECAKWLDAKHIDAEEIRTNSLCAKDASAEHLGANHIAVRDLDACNVCAQQISTHDVCVNGNVEHCTAYKAHVSFSQPYLYTLGADIDFDTIVDDPNGNVLTGPTRYIVPKTGYYIVTLGVGIQSEIMGGPAIAGIPVTRPEITVNGLRIIKGYESFLSFGGPFQNNVLTGVFKFNAGDDVRARFRIFYLDPMTGLQEYPGQIVFEAVGAQGQMFSETYMVVHYLSSECPVACPCPQASLCDIPEITCPHIEVDCHEHHDCCDHHHHDHHDKDVDWN
jgi:hypothetical protein